jgi:hypothetical protein
MWFSVKKQGLNLHIPSHPVTDELFTNYCAILKG